MIESEFDRLLRALYDAALSPEGWVLPLQAIAQALDAGNFHLMVWDPLRPEPTYSLTRGMDETVEAQYRAYYGAIDPRRLLIADMGEGDWLACDRRFDQRTVDHSEFWQDYLIPGGCRYLLGTRLVRHDGNDVFFGLHRRPGQPAFSDADIALVRRITGHFQSAARLWLRTERLRQQALLGARALDAVEHGVLALDRQARPVFANRYAESLLRDGRLLRLRLGVLDAENIDDAKALAAALQQARLSGHSRSLRLGVRDADAAERGYSVTVVSLVGRGEGNVVDRLFAAEWLLLVTPGHRRRVLGASQLMQLFRLTPAEARLARALAAGESLESYSRLAGVGLPTVRAQLNAVFGKTGTNRQSDLLRRIVVLPAMRDPR